MDVPAGMQRFVTNTYKKNVFVFMYLYIFIYKQFNYI